MPEERQNVEAEQQWQREQEMERSLRELMQGLVVPDEKLAEDIMLLEAHYGADIYPTLLYYLCHLRYSPEDAKRHWDNILELHKKMCSNLDSDVDIRVPLVSYFIHDEKSFEQPTLIEIVFFEKMQESVYRDELTGLYNYRYLKEHLAQEMQRAKRYGSMVSLMMLDIDDFKMYNDRHGHEAGNHVLVKFADLIRANIRGVDTAIRYGGEEFLLILPTTGKIGVVTVYERLQKILREARIKNADKQPLGAITVSAGVATFPADAADAGELLQHTDNAMYVAKKSGKDRIYIYGDNRRSHQRIDVQLEGSYALGDPEQRHSLQTVNISEGGVLVIIESQVPDGAIMDILLKLPGARSAIPFPGRVIRNELLDDGNYLVGLRVVEIPTQDRLLLQNFIGKNLLEG